MNWPIDLAICEYFHLFLVWLLELKGTECKDIHSFYGVMHERLELHFVIEACYPDQLGLIFRCRPHSKCMGNDLKTNLAPNKVLMD